MSILDIAQIIFLAVVAVVGVGFIIKVVQDDKNRQENEK